MTLILLRIPSHLAHRLGGVVLVLASAGPALALPEGMVVQGGQLELQQIDGNNAVIQQGSNRAAADFNSFNIHAGERVQILQPGASSSFLGRVMNGQITEIHGRLDSNGRVLLINPAGVLIGPGGVVNTAAFTATTLQVDHNRFLQSGVVDLKALAGSNPGAAVINKGTITVADGGFAALIAPQVANEGVISARLGQIQLASGTAATLDISGDGLLSVTLDPAVAGSITNQGTLQASHVRLGGGDAAMLAAATVQQSGLIEARSSADLLGASAQNQPAAATSEQSTIAIQSSGTVNLAGQLDASSQRSGLKGGRITVEGDQILVKNGARLDATGPGGGGQILVGGSWQNSDPTVRQASRTKIEARAVLDASATSQGSGGTVVAWSDLTNPSGITTVAGTLRAEGGPNGGNGGRIETSGRGLVIDGIQVSTFAQNGMFGDWLLDPYNITISNGTTSRVTGTYTANADNAVVKASDLVTALGSSNITVATGGGGTQSGDITVADAVTSSSSNTLTLQAYRNISINAAITLSNGTVNLEAINGAINGAGTITASTIDLNAATGIGDSTGLSLAAASIAADSTAGSIDVNNTSSTAVSVTSLTTSGAGSITFDQTGAGGISLVGPVTTGTGTISLTSRITVDSLNDNSTADTSTTLREAITTANASQGADTFIVFDPSLFAVGAGTITLGSALPWIATASSADALTITGPGAATLTITANNSAFGVFKVDTGGNATLSGMTVTGVNSTGVNSTVFGAIQNFGTLAIDAMTVANNSASNGGAGIFSNGTLTLTNSLIANNTTTTYGGGLLLNGTTTITNTVISGNIAAGSHPVGGGGGLWNSIGATVSISNSTIRGNSTGESWRENYKDFGGGLANIGTMTIVASEVSDNTAAGNGGGIFSENTLTVTNSGAGWWNPLGGGNRRELWHDHEQHGRQQRCGGRRRHLQRLGSNECDAGQHDPGR